MTIRNVVYVFIWFLFATVYGRLPHPSLPTMAIATLAIATVSLGGTISLTCSIWVWGAILFKTLFHLRQQVTTSNSPAIGDLSRYPYTVQIFPDENEVNYGRIGFIKLMGWKRIAIIFEDVEYFRVVIITFSRRSFTKHFSNTWGNLKNHLTNISLVWTHLNAFFHTKLRYDNNNLNFDFFLNPP